MLRRDQHNGRVAAHRKVQGPLSQRLTMEARERLRPPTLAPKIQVKIAPAFQGIQSALNESPCLGIVAKNSEILGFDIL